MAHILLSLSLFLTLLLGACADLPPTGRLASDPTIQDIFDSGQIPAEHTYYTMGSRVHPEAIIGLRQPYRLRSEIWTPIDLNEQQFRDWLFWFKIGETPTCTHSGGLLITPDGQSAGVWYSKKTLGTIWEPEQSVITVSPFSSPEGSPCRHQENVDNR